jgi:gas vesicle protein GvpK
VKGKTVPRQPATRRRRSTTASAAKSGRTRPVTKGELRRVRAELARAGGSGPSRWNANPDDVQRSVVRLVLALVEFLRKLMERQAIRRMEAGTLEPQQIEDMGLALMRLEETVKDLAARFGLRPEELNLDLGPLGKLM